MKKIALVAALAAVSASAFAQSSVTLYGRINTTVESQKIANGDRKVVVANNSSRIGFKGQEDLGGGLKASFVLEHGLNSDDGKASGSAFWGRESYVQLGGGFGSVRLGNWTPGSYYATSDYIGMHNHETGSSSDALYSTAGFKKVNKVGYFTPSYAGFTGELSVAAGEGNGERAIDLSANYDQGPLHLGAGYSKQDKNNQFAIRGLYELGAFTFGAYYQREELGNAKRNVYRISGMYALGASEFHLNYGSTNKGSAATAGAASFAGADNDLLLAKANQFTFGYNYNLSKRTKLYGYYTAIDTKLANKGQDFSSLAAGIRHNF